MDCGRAAGARSRIECAGIVKGQPQVRRRVFERHQLNEVFTQFSFEEFWRHSREA